MPSNESVFARWLDAEKEPPAVDPAAELWKWITRWKKPTITARNICQYGPRPRDLESVLSLTDALIRQKRLTPIKTRYAHMREFYIIRK